MNLLYVAYAVDIADESRLPVSKVGIAESDIDQRIRSLNSTKMPIRVELDAGFDFKNAELNARQAEYIVHALLAHQRVNGEWFKDPNEDLVDRVRKAVTKIGAVPFQAENGVVYEMNHKQQRELERMRAVFEPIREVLGESHISWEYMTWKVGVDTSLGRLQVNVNKTDLRLMLSNDDDIETVRETTGRLWEQLAYKKRLNIDSDELVPLLQKLGPPILNESESLKESR